MFKLKKGYNNILVFNTAFLGDAILTTPLLRALKVLYPDSKVTFIVKKGYEPLFLGLGFVDNIIGYDKSGSDKGISATIKFAKKLKKFRFDLVLDLHLSLRSSFICKLLGGYIIGYEEASLSWLFNARVRRMFSVKGSPFHEVERTLNILEPLLENFSLEEIKKAGGRLTVALDSSLQERASAYFKIVSGDKKVVGFAPGSIWKTKCYPPARYAEVANRLYLEGFDIALFGSNADREQVEEMKSNLEVPYYDFAYKTNLLELSTLISLMSILICNDSGAMHVAVANNIPAVAIFGATIKQLGFSPYDDKSIVVECADLKCRPCGKHGGRTCPKGHFKCMNDISSESVAEAALKLLRGE